jgi:hypothetical protein
MKIVTICICFLFSMIVQAKPVNCENAPKDAQIELPSPIDKWAVIFCSPAGHVMGAIDGTLWMTDKNTPFMFKANPKPSSDSSTHSSYFYKILSRSLNGKSKAKANRILAGSTYIEDQSLQPWQLDLRSTEGILYNIFFYLKEDIVKYVIGCKKYCKSSVLLTPKSLDQLQNEL